MRLTMIEDALRAGKIWDKWYKAVMQDSIQQTQRRHYRIKTSGQGLWCHTWAAKNPKCNFYMFNDSNLSVVQINRPSGSTQIATRVAKDANGLKYILRRAELRKPETGTIDRDAFLELTGLPAVELRRSEGRVEENWVVVARIDGRAPAQIRSDTVRFVRRCWRARLEAGDGETKRRLTSLGLGETTEHGGETGGWQQRTSNQSDREVEQTHGFVYESLKAVVGQMNGAQLRHPGRGGYRADAVIELPDDRRVLVEIKTDITARDIQCGVGQLMLYPQILGEVFTARVLLVPGGAPKFAAWQETLSAIKIDLHDYILDRRNKVPVAAFSPAFLELCGLST